VRNWTIFFMAAAGIWLLDQGIKDLFVQGWEWHHRCLSLELHYNRGVAFSLFAFLGPHLKWIQIGLVVAIAAYLITTRTTHNHPLLSGLLLGAAASNLYDRFVHMGVVDYVAWHCGFNYAVFNLADAVIDATVLLLLLYAWRTTGRGAAG
jgi:signal peptidase II